MAAGRLLMAMVLAEAPIGLLLLLAPSVVAGLLLGVTLDQPVAVIVSRIAGAAVLALSTGCVMAWRDGSSLAIRAVIVAMLVYNGTALAVLMHAALVAGLAGVLMWPAIAIHAALGIWCGVAAGSSSRV